MDPVLNSYFNRFKQSHEIVIPDGLPAITKKREAEAFEKFVNYTLLSLDDPGVFTADIELLDFVCIGEDAIGIDGIGIKVNDRLVRDIEDVKLIVEDNKKIRIDFVFIQSKMSSGIDIGEFNKFGLAVKNFFSPGYLPENNHVKEFRQIKDFIYSDAVISKFDANPSLFLYYVTTGPDQSGDQNFIGTKNILEDELRTFFFEKISIVSVDGKQLIKDCRELENKFDVQINTVDIFPLIVDPEQGIKKAYSFTCSAREFMKLLTKEDGTLRRALFNDNVRDYLGKNPVNLEIEKTILYDPGMFLLCNNGIAIVCSDFDQIRGKLVKIENPQIVNGCQTSNVLFNLKSHPNIEKVQLVVRVVSTDSMDISNKIVRGTNKQNQVLDEAFEATLPFHQDILEPFFLAFDKPVKIYYERRSRQYNNDPLIKKTQIVNLRILTQTFVAMFLNVPHEAHLHEAKLLEKYAGQKETRRIFREDQSPRPYYVCALTSYMFDKYFREKKISQHYKPFKSHLYLILKYMLGEFQSSLVNGKVAENYCDKLIGLLTEPNFGVQIKEVIKFFNYVEKEWVKAGNSKYGIKDRKDFTDLLIKLSRKNLIHDKTTTPQEETTPLRDGTILNVIFRDDGTWFGFIQRGSAYENLYFDNRYYTEDPRKLTPHAKVRYEVGSRAQGDFAKNVQLLG